MINYVRSNRNKHIFYKKNISTVEWNGTSFLMPVENGLANNRKKS